MRDLFLRPVAARRVRSTSRVPLPASWPRVPTVKLNLRLTIMSTCASRRDCTGARAVKQSIDDAARRTQSRVRAPARCGVDTSMYGSGAAPRCVEHRERGRGLGVEIGRRRRAGSRRRCASTSATPAPARRRPRRPVARARRGSCGDDARGVGRRRAARRRPARAARRAPRRVPRGAVVRVRDDVAVRGDEHHARRATRTYAAGVYSVTVIFNVPGKVAVHRRVLDPRQLLDAARDRAGVDEQQRGRACARRAARVISAARDVLRARDRGCGRRRGAATCTTRNASPTAHDHARRRRAARAAGAGRPRAAPRCAVRGCAGRSRTARAGVWSGGRRHPPTSSARAGEADELQLGLEAHAGRGLDPAPAPAAIERVARRRRGRRVRRRRSWRASPTRPRRRPAGPCSPHASMSRPAASPGGFVNTEPAFCPPGWCSRRQRTISSIRRRARRGIVGRPGERGRRPRRRAGRAPSGGSRGRARPASSVADLAVVEVETPRADDHVGGLRAVAAGVHAHRAADAARDADEELEPADARPSRPGGRAPGARPRRPASTARRRRVDVELLELAAEHDRDAGEARVGDEQVRAAPDRRAPATSGGRRAPSATACEVVLALGAHEHRERAAAPVRRERPPTARRARPAREAGPRARSATASSVIGASLDVGEARATRRASS